LVHKLQYLLKLAAHVNLFIGLQIIIGSGDDHD